MYYVPAHVFFGKLLAKLNSPFILRIINSLKQGSLIERETKLEVAKKQSYARTKS